MIFPIGKIFLESRVIGHEIRHETINPCFILIVNGGYGNWSNFTECTKSCGIGVQYRNRSCDKPVPMHGGRNCIILGNATESATCNKDPCPGKLYISSIFLFLKVFQI